jgi:hypothetical protein
MARTAKNDTTKRAAVYLLKRGLTVGDIAHLSGRDRQIVAYWEKQIPGRRDVRLALEWVRIMTMMRAKQP